AAVVMLIAPPTVAVAAAPSVMRNGFDPFRFSVDPGERLKSAPEPPAIVRMAEPWSATLVFPEISSGEMVCVGTDVAVTVAPLLNTSTSDVLGDVRLGDQLDGDVHEALPVMFHV